VKWCLVGTAAKAAVPARVEERKAAVVVVVAVVVVLWF
jgi:hypothetical protein